MEELLIFLFQAIFEIIGDILVQLFSAFLEPPIFDYTDFNWSEPLGFFGRLIFNLLAGMALGGLSLLVYDLTFIHTSEARLTSLFIAPPLSGFISYYIAEYRNKKEEDSVSRHYFWWAFAFTFGLSVIRFTYCHRP